MSNSVSRIAREPASKRLATNLIVAFLPAAVLGALLHNFIKNVLFSPWVVVTTLVLCLTPSFARWFFNAFNGHVSEPEIKLLFLLLFGLGWLATRANSEAVLAKIRS